MLLYSMLSNYSILKFLDISVTVSSCSAFVSVIVQKKSLGGDGRLKSIILKREDQYILLNFEKVMILIIFLCSLRTVSNCCVRIFLHAMLP